MRTIILFLLLSLAGQACKTKNKQVIQPEKSKTQALGDTDLTKAKKVAAIKLPPDSVGNPPATPLGKENFTVVFSNFLTAIQTEDVSAFNKYIHPAYKLYILEQPGALPQFTKVADISLFKRHFEAKSFFSIRQELTACSLRAEALPTFNCEGQVNNPAGYSKLGCFVADAKLFKKNPAHLYAGLPDTEIQQIADIKTLLTKTVLHTATGYQFHWGNIQGRWYVLFIQIITPCSA